MTSASSTRSDDDPPPLQPQFFRAAAAAPLKTRRQVQSGSGARSGASKGGLRAGSSSSTRPAETSQTKQKMRLPSEEERDEGERARQVAKEEKRKATEDNPILTEYYRHRTPLFRDESSRRSELYDPWPSQWSYLVADLIKRPVVARKDAKGISDCQLAEVRVLKSDGRGEMGKGVRMDSGGYRVWDELGRPRTLQALVAEQHV